MAYSIDPEMLKSIWEKEIPNDCPFKDNLNSKCFRENLSQTDGKISAALLISRISGTLPKPDLVYPTFPGKTLQMKKSLSKETLCEKDPLDPFSQWNSMIESLECSHIKPFSEETATNGINRLSLSQELKDPKSSSDNKLNSPVLSDIRNASKVNEALPVESLASPLITPNFDLPNLKKFASLLASENAEIPRFQQDEKIEENGRTFPFLSSKDFCEDNIREWPFPLSKYRNFDPQSALRNSAREFNPLYPFLRPSAPLRERSNKTFKEMLTDLENWVSRGLNNVFNRPMELSSEEIGSNLEKDLKNGLDLMREMRIRLYSLMRAVNQTLESDLKFLPGFEGIQKDLNKSILIIWTLIEDIESDVNEDYKNVKLACENIAGKGTVKLEQGEKPNSFITNSYNIVTENLPSIRKEFAKFREMINVVSSEIEKRS